MSGGGRASGSEAAVRGGWSGRVRLTCEAVTEYVGVTESRLRS